MQTLFAGPVSYRKTTAIRRTCRLSEAQSRDLGAAKQHGGFVRACIRYPKVNRFLQERRRFTRQHGFTDDTCATDEEINQSIKITFRECKHSPGESTSPGRSSSVWTSTHFPRQYHCVGYGSINIECNSVSVRTHYPMTMHSNMISMNSVYKL